MSSELYMQANGEPIPLTTERIQQFGQDIIVAVQQQMSEGKTIQPSVYFLPGDTPTAQGSFRQRT